MISRSMLVLLCLAGWARAAAAAPATAPAAPSTAPAAPATAPLWLEPRVTELNIAQRGTYVVLSDRSILCLGGGIASISDDDGATWQRHEMFSGQTIKAGSGKALRTRDGIIVYAFLETTGMRWEWDKEKNTTEGEARLHVWAARSSDGGKTWNHAQLIQDGYCGAVRDIIETSGGNIVVSAQKYLPEASRHAAAPIVSTDQGKTWQAAPLLDLGSGRGHHDGAYEATLVELRDKRIWMLLRTNLDFFHESFSSDGGLSWSPIAPTAIDASSSPGSIKRLHSGRLALVWNRLFPEGRTDGRRLSGQSSTRPASWHRQELSIAFSEDDGRTWSRPAVIARQPGRSLSYPDIYERRPGQLWVALHNGVQMMSLREADFVPAAPDKH